MKKTLKLLCLVITLLLISACSITINVNEPDTDRKSSEEVTNEAETEKEVENSKIPEELCGKYERFTGTGGGTLESEFTLSSDGTFYGTTIERIPENIDGTLYAAEERTINFTGKFDLENSEKENMLQLKLVELNKKEVSRVKLEEKDFYLKGISDPDFESESFVLVKHHTEWEELPEDIGLVLPILPMVSENPEQVGFNFIYNSDNSNFYIKTSN